MISDERIKEIEDGGCKYDMWECIPWEYTRAFEELLAERKQLVAIAEYSQVMADELRTGAYPIEDFDTKFKAWKESNGS